MAFKKKYLLSEEQKINILKPYLIGEKKLIEIYKEQSLKQHFNSLNLFYTYVGNTLIGNESLVQIALGCRVSINQAVIGSKKESYWESEEDIFFNAPMLTDLQGSEKKISLDLEYKF
jgi:hypothetical protein